jgi:hypothetical protein
VLAIQLGLAPLAFVPTYLLAGAIARVERKADQALPQGTVEDDTGAVIVHAPFPGAVAYAVSLRRSRAQPLPEYAYELYTAPGALELTRIDLTTLELAPSAGYCSARSECVGRPRARPFRVGEQIELWSMRVEVRELDARGAPRRVRFHFKTPLEDPERKWLIWTARGLEPFTPPALHQTLSLPALSRLDALR